MVSLGELFFLALAFAAGAGVVALAVALGVPAWLAVVLPVGICAVALAIELVGDRE